MFRLSTLLALLAVTVVNAVPLNINLGAYSPALVVGDGEISFGSGTDVSGLMSSLQGAAVPAAGAAAVAAAANPASGAAAGTPATGTTTTGATAGKEAGKAVVNNNAFSAPSPAAVAAAVPATNPVVPAAADQQAPVSQAPVDQAPPAAASPSPVLQSGLGMGPDKKFILPRTAEAEAEANPGMEEAFRILKRDVAAINAGKPVESVLTARDLQTFQAALNYATAAMKIQPPVELGTGEGGAGVGIKVGSGAAGSVATAATKPAKRGMTAIKVISKRDKFDSESRDLASSSSSERSVDAVNLNLGEQAGAVSLTITEI